MRRGAVLLLVGAMGITACSADPSPPEAAGWVDLLARVPDTPETRAEVVRGFDLERAWAAVGGGAFTDDMTQEEIDRAWRTFFDEDVWPPAWTPIVTVLYDGDERAAAEEDLGFGLPEIERTMSVGEYRSFEVLGGDFDDDTIAEAAHQGAWGPDVVVGSSGDFTTYSWGPDLAIIEDGDDTRIVIADPSVTAPTTMPGPPPTRPSTMPSIDGAPSSVPSLASRTDPSDRRVSPERRPTPARPLGYGQRLALNPDGTLFWTLTDVHLQAGMDASTGAAPSLADDTNIRSAAQVLDDLGTYSFTLSSGEVGANRTGPIIDGPVDPAPEPDPDSLLKPYRAVAFGSGVDDDGSFAALVLMFDDAAAASESATRLARRLESERSIVTRQPWSELFPSADVTADGRAVTAVLRGDHVSRALGDSFSRRESIFWSE